MITSCCAGPATGGDAAVSTSIPPNQTMPQLWLPLAAGSIRFCPQAVTIPPVWLRLLAITLHWWLDLIGRWIDGCSRRVRQLRWPRCISLGGPQFTRGAQYFEHSFRFCVAMFASVWLEVAVYAGASLNNLTHAKPLLTNKLYCTNNIHITINLLVSQVMGYKCILFKIFKYPPSFPFRPLLDLTLATTLRPLVRVVWIKSLTLSFTEPAFGHFLF